jgi:mitochondrial nucleoid factor 1
MAQRTASQLYFDLIRLFKQWPIDKSKTGRDLGERLRQQFSQAFALGENSQVSVPEWNRFFENMKYLISNDIKNRYVRDRNWTASSLSREQLRFLLSNKSLQANKDFMKKMK